MKLDIGAEFRHKIKTSAEIIEKVGARPRQQKVIMCHGTFDVVHPGHIRHLLYARSKADVLIASMTSDSHISKANFRPYVPEELRAMNLAALEMVDFVVIDRTPTALENLRAIQPDYFAKGYEYVDGGVHPKTQEEMDVLESYGGEIIFTPGDIVYSSSKFIENSPPNLSTENLVTLMEAEDISFDDLRSALDACRSVRAHVVGDVIVDSLTYCSLIGSNAKTPTFSVRYESKNRFAGGAAVVAKHLRAAGAEVTLSTVMGDDEMREFVLDDLAEAGVKCDPIVDPTRPTTVKDAFIAGGYRLLKVDTLDNRTISDKILEELCARTSDTSCDAVVFSDFRHGIFDRVTCPRLIEAIPERAFRVADSQVASRWGNILDFPGFDLITPNEKEARFALADQDSVVRPLALDLFQRSKTKTLILKLGSRGALVYREREIGDMRAFFVINSFADTVVDAVGAGDALLAYSTLALKATGVEVIAATLGSLAAAIECERDGNIPVTPNDLLEKIDQIQRRAEYAVE
ncbi:MAG: adenylyltransferase/cytidyltransferase family protein [bacterium]|nr:adenylyltransferase/cytidyltransferase family protein [bacterium]